MNDLLEQLPVGCLVLELTPDGSITIHAINRRALALLPGCPCGQPASLLLSYLTPEAREAFLPSWQQCLDSHGSLLWQGPLLAESPEGEGPWVQLELVPTHGPNGTRRWQGVLVDLSAYQAREVALKARLEESRRLLDSVPIAIAIAQLNDDDPEITTVNAGFERDFGYSLGQVPRLSAWAERAYPDPEYRRAMVEQWHQVVEQARSDQGSVAGMEGVVITASGVPKDVLFSARTVGSDLLVTLLDVTDRRQAERDLRSAREQLAHTALAITEAIPVGTYTMVLPPDSPMASFSFMSERFLQLTGLDREEALADPLKAFACVHPDDYDAWVNLNAEAFAHKRPFFGQTRVVVNNQVRWITAESVPRERPDGTTVWEGVLIDVTDRIEAQHQLERSQDHLKRVLNNLPVAIAINTLTIGNTEVTFLNDHFTRTLGYTLADIAQLDDWARLAYPDPAYREQVFTAWNAALESALARKGSVQQDEYRVRARDGRDLQMLISAVVLDDMVLVALIDVTRSREAERELLEALERERANEESLRRGIEEKLRVSLSASAVAHEISQPLSAILLNSKLALRALEAGDGQISLLQSLLEPLVGEAERMDLITERISMLLRNVDTTLIPLDLREVVSSANLQLQPRLLAAGVDIECHLPSHVCLVQGDAVQLQLAVVNLLRNGLEALQDRVAPNPRLQLTLRRNGEWLELVVADNGAGFPADFDPNLPLSSTKSQGSGIGLYLVRLTMENHGGRMHHGNSAELGGAEVVLRLPAAQAGI